MYKSIGFLGLFLAMLGLACSSSTTTGSSSGTSGTSGGTSGVTSCGTFGNSAKSCQAGQYCKDETLSICENGCLSNNNCAGDQACDKSNGATVGNCVNKAPTTTTTCADLCKKGKACEPSLDVARCEGACTGLSEGCKSCVISKACSAPASACDAECK
jgi:hypothetical protein